MAVQIEFTTTMPAVSRHTVHLNVWPVSVRMRGGQIELYTDHGRSVVLTAREWYDLHARVEQALQSELGGRP